jgi:lipoprotein-anchoring transpeptidase ErfK/SrfK
MQIKLFIALATCSVLFVSENIFAWSDDPDDADTSSSEKYYYYSNDNTNDAYNDSMIQQAEAQQGQYQYYAKPKARTTRTTTTTTTSGYSKSGRLPKEINANGERTIVIDPRVHAWGAYDTSGKLVRSGTATAGSGWCSDIGRPCRTKSGVFRINSLGDRNCVSNKFPIGEGGAPMPYCMYFNGGQAIHGSYQVAAANISHGCVRVSVQEAQWLRFEFAQVGTKVIVKSY